MDNAIYIVFSATPTHMGRFIRLTTRNRYNHVSLSFEEELNKLYSFARLHRTIPLYGGFVVESILRYRSFAGQAQVKICRLPVAEPHFTYLCNYLERLWNDREEYIYNTPAAVASIIRRYPAIPKAHTCVTFAQEILVRCRLDGAEAIHCPTVHCLEELLAPYVIYEGAVPQAPKEVWGEDTFPTQISTHYAVYTTARHFGRLAQRLLRGAS